MLPNPYSEDVLPSIHGDSQDHIRRLRHIPVILPHLVVDGIHEDERIHCLQRPVLPRCYLWHDLFADLRHQLRRDLHIIQFFDLLRDVPLAHPAGIQRQDFFLHPVRVPVVLPDDLRLEAPVPVPGYPDVYFPQLGLHRFLRVPVPVVGGAGCL